MESLLFYMQEKDLHFQKERASRAGKGAIESSLWPLISVLSEVQRKTALTTCQRSAVTQTALKRPASFYSTWTLPLIL